MKVYNKIGTYKKYSTNVNCHCQSKTEESKVCIASPFQNGANVVYLRKTNTNSFILSWAYINISSNERN